MQEAQERRQRLTQLRREAETSHEVRQEKEEWNPPPFQTSSEEYPDRTNSDFSFYSNPLSAYSGRPKSVISKPPFNANVSNPMQNSKNYPLPPEPPFSNYKNNFGASSVEQNEFNFSSFSPSQTYEHPPGNNQSAMNLPYYVSRAPAHPTMPQFQQNTNTPFQHHHSTAQFQQNTNTPFQHHHSTAQFQQNTNTPFQLHHSTAQFQPHERPPQGFHNQEHSRFQNSQFQNHSKHSISNQASAFEYSKPQYNKNTRNTDSFKYHGKSSNQPSYHSKFKKNDAFEFKPEMYFNKSMLEDPWKHLLMKNEPSHF